MRAVLFYLTLVGVVACIQSCAPPKVFSELETERTRYKNEREELYTENEKLVVENTELAAKLELAEKDAERIEGKGYTDAAELKDLKAKYNEATERYNELNAAHQALINGSDSETRELMSKLDRTQKDLYQREDLLNQTKARLDQDREALDKLKQELNQKSESLLELERIIAQKDAQADALKQKLSSALTGFENQGLTITKKNGKVYVSLDEKLLFPSGSAEVDPRGKTALTKLAGVLAQNPEINVMIEGHTDDVPIVPGSKYTDNWDLSVSRATAIIRILLTGSNIDPKRLTAAGRGEFVPVDPSKTPEARQRNRRTEIILEPRLDEVFNLLDE
ncbi:MAG: OmpA family protein [Bacteroidales bacterium]|nr:OmpA family protein [Bacteroidales bacterium]